MTGAAQLWHVYAIALFQGITTAIDNPARQAFVSEMVPPDKLANAVALNSASFNARPPDRARASPASSSPGGARARRCCSTP